MEFLRLADTMEGVHSVINPLQQRLLTAQRSLRTAGKLSGHLDVHVEEVNSAADALESIRAFPKEHAKALHDILTPANEACEFFGSRYPALASRMFIHSEMKDDTCLELLTSRLNPMDSVV